VYYGGIAWIADIRLMFDNVQTVFDLVAKLSFNISRTL
jgi:hypothetical protein